MQNISGREWNHIHATHLPFFHAQTENSHLPSNAASVWALLLWTGRPSQLSMGRRFTDAPCANILWLTREKCLPNREGKLGRKRCCEYFFPFTKKAISHIFMKSSTFGPHMFQAIIYSVAPGSRVPSVWKVQVGDIRREELAENYTSHSPCWRELGWKGHGRWCPELSPFVACSLE